MLRFGPISVSLSKSNAFKGAVRSDQSRPVAVHGFMNAFSKTCFGDNTAPLTVPQTFPNLIIPC